MTDLIGDIHGHADELELLLKKMGYTKSNGTYSHPTRKVLFVGDYIDRGSKIKETLEIVKAMTDSGNAVALMGNHEYNALCFHTKNPEGGHLRKHDIKNVIQHFQTLKQFQNKQAEYDEYIQWFKTLPLYFETDTFRATHACWDNENIELLREVLIDDRISGEIIKESVKIGSPLNDAIDQTLKGKEAKLPDGARFKDKDENERNHIRIKWWENPCENTYKSISVLADDSLPEKPIHVSNLKSKNFYNPDEKMVFFGHYWLVGEPRLQRHNVCCLDYSVAKGGNLIAYRHDGEKELDKSKFVVV